MPKTFLIRNKDLLFPDVMKTVRHHLIAQLSRGLQGHFGRVWEGFERLLIRNKYLLFPGVRNRPFLIKAPNRAFIGLSQ